MKNYLRILSLFIATVMLVGALASCDILGGLDVDIDETDENSASTKAEETAVNTEVPSKTEESTSEESTSKESTSKESNTSKYDKNGYLMDDLPEDLRYNGEEITVLAWDDSVCKEFDVEKLGEDEVENSIYFRDRLIESRFNIKIKYTLTHGNANNIRDYKQKVEVACFAGEEYYDIVAGYTRAVAICAANGVLQDLSGIHGNNYLDLEKPWWSSDLVAKTSNSYGRYYYVTGDASASLAQMIYCVYFNADIINNTPGLESPYDLVDNNEWTIEKLLTMSKGFYQDNGNVGKDMEDNYGLVAYYYDWPALLHGCGIDYMTKDVRGNFILDPDIKSQKTIDLMNKFQKIVDDESLVCDANKGTYSTVNFKDGLSTFIITHSGSGIDAFKTVETFEMGVVPCPKYDTNQKNYYSTVRQPVTFFGIMCHIGADRISMASAVLECWGSQAYRMTTPAIFESYMKYKGTDNPKIPEMLQLIKDTAYFDCARIYAEETNYLCDKPGRFLQYGTEWNDYISGDLQIVEQKIPSLSTKLNAVE